ncbi:exopolysaccharide repeat unit polymerase [Hyalangium rubrum]|uniref:Exopolysaccharide repeat unit polymerase n=1 Tax=Hyalangium rubrum TaxID=3103134 RepID=A0ABU5GXU7_9BACT|nr:exopolysaccharide repeat unit polymerase [Hyalangium sp. s54d21]MDY7226005.1 exopolysaccharide repeat unit polymerase [Hyalangium sp. s54d21]
MEAFLSRTPVFLTLIAGVVMATLGLLVLFPPVAMLPMVAAILVWVLAKVPIRYPVLTLLAILLIVDCAVENPYSGLWKSPLSFVGRLFFINLNVVTGVPGLGFTLIDLAVFGLTALYVYRNAVGLKTDEKVVPLPRPLVMSLLLILGTISWMYLWGYLRGGDMRPAKWQLQKLLLMPVFVMLFNAAIRGPQDFRVLGRIIVAAAFTKAFLGAFFIVVIARPGGLYTEYATTHSDTMIYVTGLSLAVASWAEEPNRKNFWRMLIVCGVIFMGMNYNDRRLAYASFNQCLVAIYLISPWSKVKVYATRAGILMAPLFLLYVAVGWANPTGIFSPVNTFKSMIVGEHNDTGVMDYRDVENFNVIATWQKNPMLGTGYGHGFDEVMKLADISHLFEDYLYHPHNSVLGLLAFGGVVGFTGVWLFVAFTVFFAVRAYHRAHVPQWRAGALVAVAIVVAYTNQCFGDMGITSWYCTILMALAVTIAGKLATLTGAWRSTGPAPSANPAESGAVEQEGYRRT